MKRYFTDCFPQQRDQAVCSYNFEENILLEISSFLSDIKISSLSEILFRTDISYQDTNEDDILTNTTVRLQTLARNLTVIDTISFPFFKRNLVEERGHRDYFPERAVTPRLVVLHRFGGAAPSTVQRYLTDNQGADLLPDFNLSSSLYCLLSQGFSCNYIVVQTNNGSLVIRMADPALYKPQSAGIYNSVAISALVQTNQDQEVAEDALQDLLSVISSDLEKKSLILPHFLLSHQELGRSADLGRIANMDRLRNISGMRKPSEDNIQLRDLISLEF